MIRPRAPIYSRLSKKTIWGAASRTPKGILDSDCFIWEANQPDYLNPRVSAENQICPIWVLDLNACIYMPHSAADACIDLGSFQVWSHSESCKIHHTDTTNESRAADGIYIYIYIYIYMCRQIPAAAAARRLNRNEMLTLLCFKCACARHCYVSKQYMHETRYQKI
jgi:hypothetical protein